MTRRGLGGALHIGISGWLYPPWRARFYPPGLPHHAELAYASRRVGSVEINGTFYSLQRPARFRLWHEQTPEGFVFALKGSRFITHMKKLRDVETPLANFFASGLLALGDKLGPILWQFPEALPFDEARFEAFFAQLPRSTAAAARLARRHDARVDGRSVTRATRDLPVRHAVEVRHPSFFAPRFIEQLRRHDIALVASDAASKWPYAEDVTADFVYVRLHGSQVLYTSQYSDAELDRWAERVRLWSRGRAAADAVLAAAASPAPEARARDVYVYFDNDSKVHAPFDAMRLMQRLGVPAKDADAAPQPMMPSKQRAA